MLGVVASIFEAERCGYGALSEKAGCEEFGNCDARNFQRVY